MTKSDSDKSAEVVVSGFGSKVPLHSNVLAVKFQKEDAEWPLLIVTEPLDSNKFNELSSIRLNKDAIEKIGDALLQMAGWEKLLATNPNFVCRSPLFPILTERCRNNKDFTD